MSILAYIYADGAIIDKDVHDLRYLAVKDLEL